jgi:hypothetical protein
MLLVPASSKICMNSSTSAIVFEKLQPLPRLIFKIVVVGFEILCVITWHLIHGIEILDRLDPTCERAIKFEVPGGLIITIE